MSSSNPRAMRQLVIMIVVFILLSSTAFSSLFSLPTTPFLITLTPLPRAHDALLLSVAATINSRQEPLTWHQFHGSFPVTTIRDAIINTASSSFTPTTEVASITSSSNTTISLNLTTLQRYLDSLNYHVNDSEVARDPLRGIYNVMYVEGNLEIQVDGQLTDARWQEPISPWDGIPAFGYTALLPADVSMELVYPDASTGVISNRSMIKETVEVPAWYLMRMKGLWNDTHVALAIQWNDTTPNTEKNTWHYHAANRSWHNDRQADEDELGLLFVNHLSLKNCTSWDPEEFDIFVLLAGMEDNGSIDNSFVAQFFASEFGTANFIRWGAALTNPLGYADDLYLKLGGTWHADDNSTDSSSSSTAASDGDHVYYARILADGNESAGFTPNSYNYQVLGTGVFNASDRPYWDENGTIINHDNDSTSFPDGFTLPGYRLLGRPNGSRGEILAKGQHDPITGQWTLEMIIPFPFKGPPCGEDDGGYFTPYVYIKDGEKKTRYWSLVETGLTFSPKQPFTWGITTRDADERATPWFPSFLSGLLPSWMSGGFIPMVVLLAVISVIVRHYRRMTKKIAFSPHHEKKG